MSPGFVILLRIKTKARQIWCKQSEKQYQAAQIQNDTKANE